MTVRHFLTLLIFAIASNRAWADGPDVIVGDITDITRWAHADGITPFSVGSTACNIGDAPVQWQGDTNRHPVIAQNLYRHRDGSFEQIGQSWMKHGFAADTRNACAVCQDPGSDFLLGIGCSDTYRSQLNGLQASMRPRSMINPLSGLFPHPSSAPPLVSALDRRMQVLDFDLDPDLNIDASYFLEVIYIAPDDAKAGNANNNASYRQCFVTESTPGSFTLNLFAALGTQQQTAAVAAWLELDQSSTWTFIDIPNDGRLVLAASATELNNGLWRYKYAICNLNSDRCVGRFSITKPPDAVLQNMGFHDVDSHSGESVSSDDWSIEHTHGLLTWLTEPHAKRPNANAIRWGTLYNFRFDVNAPPVSNCPLLLGLFKPGTPSTLSVPFLGPSQTPPDCNVNSIPDVKELNQSPRMDCNRNGILDDCEATACPGIMRGDLNCDGAITLEDVTPFTQAILIGGFSCQADLNNDQIADARDILVFTAAVTLPR